MDAEIRGFLLSCETMDFGKGELSAGESSFYRLFDNDILSLSGSLPRSVRTESMIFLMKYSGVLLDGKPDFFANFYPPAWSILYWLTQHSPAAAERLEEEDVTSAVAGHCMAMFLHSLDDHLIDRQIPVSPLTLLLRSQAWAIMNRAFGSLAKRVPAGERTVRKFTDRYYSSVQGSANPRSLDGYCDHFRKQMAMGMIAPVLLSMKMTGISDFTRDLESAYGSFGVAWRLLDDIRDMRGDIGKGIRSSVYYCLSKQVKARWNNNLIRNRNGVEHCARTILAQIREAKVIDRIKSRICAELKTAARKADQHQLKGLAYEFRCLARPLTGRGGGARG